MCVDIMCRQCRQLTLTQSDPFLVPCNVVDVTPLRHDLTNATNSWLLALVERRQPQLELLEDVATAEPSVVATASFYDDRLEAAGGCDPAGCVASNTLVS